MEYEYGCLFVVSDLHLGGGGRNDAFREAEGAFLQWYRSIPRSADRIILAGDIFDLLEDNLGDICGAHEEVACIVYEARSFGHWVGGNHDADVIGLPAHFNLPHSVRVLHGHRFDPWNSGRLGWLGDLYARAEGLAQRIGFNFPSKALRKLRGIGWQKRAFKHMKIHGIKTLVMGHTHEAGIWGEGDRIIVNVGSWTEGKPYHFARIDLSTGHAVLERYRI